MNWAWRRVTPHVYALDDTWSVVEESPGQWRVYESNKACLQNHDRPEAAMDEAERRKKARVAV